MTARETLALLDRTGLLLTKEGLSVPVTIIDVANAFGVDRVVIKPTGGAGTATVNLDRITLDIK